MYERTIVSVHVYVRHINCDSQQISSKTKQETRCEKKLGFFLMKKEKMKDMLMDESKNDSGYDLLFLSHVITTTLSSLFVFLLSSQSVLLLL